MSSLSRQTWRGVAASTCPLNIWFCLDSGRLLVQPRRLLFDLRGQTPGASEVKLREPPRSNSWRRKWRDLVQPRRLLEVGQEPSFFFFKRLTSETPTVWMLAGSGAACVTRAAARCAASTASCSGPGPCCRRTAREDAPQQRGLQPLWQGDVTKLVDRATKFCGNFSRTL